MKLFATTLATLGYRHERARYAGEDTAGSPPVRETQKQRAWEAGLRHELDTAWTVFGRTARSFRFANAEEIYESDVFFSPQFQVLRPQHARTRELGAQWRRGGHAARASVFRTDVYDEIHLDPFTTGVGNTNLPPSRRQGLELHGEIQAKRTLSLTGAYAYTEARFLEGSLPGSLFAIGSDLSVAGKTVPLVPRHKLNLAAFWDLAARTRLSGSFTAVSKQVLDNDEPNTLGHRIPAYYLADLKLAQRFSWGQIAATVNNLFGEDYYTYAVRSAFTADRYAVYPLPGRTFGVALELRI